jgi:hypothetical protein
LVALAGHPVADLVRLGIPALSLILLVRSCTRLDIGLLLLLCEREATDEDRRGQRRESCDHAVISSLGNFGECAVRVKRGIVNSVPGTCKKIVPDT